MTSRSSPSPDVTEGIFAFLIAAYGMPKVRSMWEGTSRELVSKVWLAGLRRFEPEAVAEATAGMSDRFDDSGQRIAWPPTLPEFIDMVEPIHRRIRQSKADARALAAPPDPYQPSSQLADPKSPVVIAAREELRRFVAARRMPS